MIEKVFGNTTIIIDRSTAGVREDNPFTWKMVHKGLQGKALSEARIAGMRALRVLPVGAIVITKWKNKHEYELLRWLGFEQAGYKSMAYHQDGGMVRSLTYYLARTAEDEDG